MNEHAKVASRTSTVNSDGSFYTEAQQKASAIIDSGASSHMVNDSAIIKNPRQSSASVNTAGKEELKAEHEGDMYVTLGETSSPTNLHDVLYVLALSENLISVLELCDACYRVLFTKHNCNVYYNTKLISKGF